MRGGVPAFKGYRGFPASALHLGERGGGARHPRRSGLDEGDIVGIDMGVDQRRLLRRLGAHLPVGEISAEAHELLEVTREAL